MSDTSHTPAGFCPRCGYPIDPGRCSECGEFVSRRRLAKRPRELERRKRRRRVLLVVVGVVVLIGAHQLYYRVAWLHYVPSGLLLSFQSQNTEEMTSIDGEICRRLLRGVLTETERQQVFERGIVVLSDFGLHDRCPAARPIRLTVRVETSALLQDWSSAVLVAPTLLLTIENLRFVSDGREMPSPPTLSGSWPGAERLLMLPSQSEGAHDVTISGTASIRAGMQGLVVASRSFELRRSFSCESGPCEAFSKPVWSERDADFIRTYAELAVGVDSEREMRYQFSAPRATFVLAGRLQVRVDESHEWQPLAPDGHEADTHVFGVGRTDGVGAGYSGALLKVNLTSAPQFDVRWVPDACAAWSAGCDEHFGGVIEWIGLKITPAWGPRQLRPMAKPTHVFPASK